MADDREDLPVLGLTVLLLMVSIPALIVWRAYASYRRRWRAGGGAVLTAAPGGGGGGGGGAPGPGDSRRRGDVGGSRDTSLGRTEATAARHVGRNGGTATVLRKRNGAGIHELKSRAGYISPGLCTGTGTGTQGLGGETRRVPQKLRAGTEAGTHSHATGTGIPNTGAGIQDPRTPKGAPLSGESVTSEGVCKRVRVNTEGKLPPVAAVQRKVPGFLNSGCIPAGGGVLPERIRQAALRRDLCGTCGSPRLSRKGGCLCTLRLYSRDPPSPPDTGLVFSNFRLQPWDATPLAKVRRRVTFNAEIMNIPEALPCKTDASKTSALIKPEAEVIYTDGVRNHGNGGTAPGQGKLAPMAAVDSDDTLESSKESTLGNGGCHVICNGTTPSSTFDDDVETNMADNPSRLSLLSNMTVRSAPASCYRTPEVERARSDVRSLLDMRSEGPTISDSYEFDGLLMISKSGGKKSSSSFELGPQNGQLLRELSPGECASCSGLPYDEGAVPPDMKFLQLSEDDHCATLDKLRSCRKVRLHAPLYHACAHAALLAGLFLTVWLSGILAAVVSRDSDMAMATGVSFLAAVLAVMATAWSCMLIRKQLDKVCREMVREINVALSENHIIMGVVEHGRWGCHSLHIHFLYFDLENCVAFVAKNFGENVRAEKSKHAFHSKVSENGSLMFSELGFVSPVTETTEAEREEKARELLLKHCGAYVENASLGTLPHALEPLHARGAPCLCQYVDAMGLTAASAS